MVKILSEPREILSSSDIPQPFVSHLQCPTPFSRTDGSLGLLVSSRSTENRSYTFLYELDPETFKIIRRPEKPIFDLGNPGAFDSMGVMTSCALEMGSKLYLYYMGWNIPNDVPFHNAIGLAISEDNGKSFRRFSDGPILDRNLSDPYYVATPFVHREMDAFAMYYMSGLPWRKRGEKWQPYYEIRKAISQDGIRFVPETTSLVSPIEGKECAVARPWIWHSSSSAEMKMLFCGRMDFYSIYLAKQEGLSWKRLSQPLIAPTGQHGSRYSNNISYPALWEHRGRKIVFCNGNDYGRSSVLSFEIEDN
jgi:hypothetical protein